MRRWALALLLAPALLAEPAFRYSGLPCETIQNNGPSASRIDIVVLGDGYNKEDRAAFGKEARTALEELWRISPFKEYRRYFNVHLVMPESRVPKRGRNPGPEAYAFGSHLDTTGQNMVLMDKSHFLEAARNAPDVDVIVAISNLPGRPNSHSAGVQDGSRSIPDVVLTHQDYPLAHELGHGIGHLGDEYESTSHLADRRALPTNPTRDLDAPNLSLSQFINAANRDTLRATAKWKHFMELPDSYPLVSAYQGGWYQSIGVWRPSFRCVMKSSTGAPFCPVCHEELVKNILKQCGEKFDDAAYHRQFPLKRWK